MLGRRGLLAGMGGLAAGLAGCGPSSEAPPPVPPIPRLSAATEPARDAALEAALPPRVGDDPFAPLAHALRVLEGRGEARALVVVLGDSHAAGPVLSERLRELFQSRYGAIGPGRYAPGRAQRFFNPAAVRLEQNGEWQARNALRAATPGPFGLTGYRLSGERPGDSIALRVNDPEGFDRLHLTIRFGPEGGRLRFRLDGRESEPGSTRADAPGIHLFQMAAPPRSREIAIELLGDGPVELLGWGVDRRGRGVLVEAFGINGATISTLENRDAGLLERELTAYMPALLVLEYGTNEATDRDLDAEGYAAQLTRQVARLKRMLPRTGILLMGVPDAARPARRGSACGGALTPLPALNSVREAQRRVAREQRIGYFDWGGAVTRGLCQLPSLVRAAPPLMRPDLVHFTPEGYRLTAERLFARIMQGAGLDPRLPNA